MRTYYRGHDAMVTSEFFVRRSGPEKSYAIRDLRCVRIARDLGNRRSRLLAAGGFAAVSAGSASASMITGDGRALPLVLLAAPVAVAGALAWRRRPASWELRAVYHGQPIVLYQSRDSTSFHQVSRALRRAVEANGELPDYVSDDAA